MPKHIKPFDNHNQPIVDVDDETLPLCYFNHVRLKKGEQHSYSLDRYETAIVLVTGTCNITVDQTQFEKVGTRTHLWEGKPDSVYVPIEAQASITCLTDEAEIYIGGGKIDEKYEPFRVSPEEVEVIQYGSDDTKTHRKIQHVLGHNAEGKCGRILVSELFTVGAGGWSGFPPHKHDTDRLPKETRFEEFYQFRFNPENGFGAQFLYADEEAFGPVEHIKNHSNILIDKGYHPCVVAPGYQMYYFTLIVGETTRSLIQFFEPQHEYQVQTIPGLKDMIAGFK